MPADSAAELVPGLDDAVKTTLNLYVTGRRQAFDAYFSGIASMAQHPGTTRDAAQPMTLEQARDKALSMLRLRDELVALGKL